MTEWTVENGEIVVSREVRDEGQADLEGDETEVAVEETLAAVPDDLEAASEVHSALEEYLAENTPDRRGEKSISQKMDEAYGR